MGKHEAKLEAILDAHDAKCKTCSVGAYSPEQRCKVGLKLWKAEQDAKEKAWASPKAKTYNVYVVYYSVEGASGWDWCLTMQEAEGLAKTLKGEGNKVRKWICAIPETVITKQAVEDYLQDEYPDCLGED